MLDFSDDIAGIGEQAAPEESSLWVDKYRPKTLDEMCLGDELKELFARQISSGDVQNVTLAGPPGTGKTTLAMALANGIHAETLFVPCAGGEGRIETVWTKIVPFCQCASGSRKVVILDELDSASANQANSFQKALRNVIEKYSDCRFIATANYADNIIEPVLSRLPPVSISFDGKQLLLRLVDILKKENISVDKNGLSKSLKKFVMGLYPDVRSIVGKLQFACSSGSLSSEKLESLSAFSDGDEDAVDRFFEQALEIIKQEIPLQSIRRNVAEFVSRQTSAGKNASILKMSDAYVFSRGLVEYLVRKGTLDDRPEAAIDYISQLETIEKCVDKEIQLFKLLIMTHRLLKQ